MLKVFVINPGSTTTKIAVYTERGPVFEKNIEHPMELLSKFSKVTEELPIRLESINNAIKENNINLMEMDAFVGRGGPLKPLEGGTYNINEKMLEDLSSCKYSNHASNLGALIAHKFAKEYNKPAFVVDPVTVDNFIPEARISGMPEIERKCRSHALNIKSVAREVANKIKKDIKKCNFVVAHLGTGISICALKGGKIIDVNDALLGEGPFSAERAGTLPIGPLVKLCYSKKYTEEELLNILSKESGLKGYLKTNDVREVLQRIKKNDKKAKLILNAMLYQIAKQIGSMAVALKGKLDGIILTGGMTKSPYISQSIKNQVKFLGKVYVIPGEKELKALAEGAFRVLRKEEKPKEYE
jgi:butyrate kinase